MSGIDADTIRYALRTARTHGFSYVRLKVGDESFRAVLSDEEEAWNDEPTPTVAAILDAGSLDETIDVKAPCVGYFQEGKMSIKVGDKVESGSLIGQIVALGLTNDVPVKKGGEVTEILVKAGDAVEFGQPMIRIKVGS